MTARAPRPAWVGDWSPETQPPWPGERVVLPPYRLFVRRSPPSGDHGPEPAVLVHGLGGSSLNWTDLMALLRDRLDGAAPDLPGFGHSLPPDDGDYSLDAHVRAVTAYVEHLDRGPVHLFGNSLGGAVAVRLAARRPDLVRSLVLVSPALPDLLPRRDTVAVPALAVPGLGQWLWGEASAMAPERQVEAMVELCFGDPASVPPVRRDEAAEEYRRRFTLPYAGDALAGSARGLMTAFLARGARSLWQDVSTVGARTLLLYGGRDKLVRAARGSRARAAIAGSTLVVLPRLGHVAQMEDPVLVARLVRQFLDGSSPFA